jgi:hypothetical protein
MKEYLPKMINKNPREEFEHKEMSGEISDISKHEESEINYSSNQIIDSPIQKKQNSSGLQELKQITEKSAEHSEIEDVIETNFVGKSLNWTNLSHPSHKQQTQISISEVEEDDANSDDANDQHEESESDYGNSCSKWGNEIIKKKHQRNGKHQDICYQCYRANKLKDKPMTKRDIKEDKKGKNSKEKHSEQKVKLHESQNICRKWDNVITNNKHQNEGEYLDICYECYKKKMEKRKKKKEQVEEEDKVVEANKKKKKMKKNEENLCICCQEPIGDFYLDEKPKKYKDCCQECFQIKLKKNKKKSKQKDMVWEKCESSIGSFYNMSKAEEYKNYWEEWYHESLKRKEMKKKKKKQKSEEEQSYEKDQDAKKVRKLFQWSNDLTII